MIQEFWNEATKWGLAYNLQMIERVYDQQAEVVTVLFECSAKVAEYYAGIMCRNVSVYNLSFIVDLQKALEISAHEKGLEISAHEADLPEILQALKQ